jgi:regulator of cell morphogenesis and NO signaling
MSTMMHQTVGSLVTQRPGRARLFEKLGIDYCCGGKISLQDACNAKHLNLNEVVASVEAVDRAPASTELDVTKMSLGELVDHIEQTHHRYLKTELPRLMPLVEKIASRHSDKNAKLPQLPVIFAAFRSELESQMVKEEQILFPWIRQIDRNQIASAGCGGSIENPIRVMELEHQHAGDALALMRHITDDFSTPSNACNTYRAVMHALNELESDMHQHVHKENNVLFPRAVLAAGDRSTQFDARAESGETAAAPSLAAAR